VCIFNHHNSLSQVPRLEPTVIPIRYGAVGCPVVFQTTASSSQALVRYEESKNRTGARHDSTCVVLCVHGMLHSFYLGLDLMLLMLCQ